MSVVGFLHRSPFPWILCPTSSSHITSPNSDQYLGFIYILLRHKAWKLPVGSRLLKIQGSDQKCISLLFGGVIVLCFQFVVVWIWFVPQRVIMILIPCHTSIWGRFPPVFKTLMYLFVCVGLCICHNIGMKVRRQSTGVSSLILSCEL